MASALCFRVRFYAKTPARGPGPLMTRLKGDRGLVSISAVKVVYWLHESRRPLENIISAPNSAEHFNCLPAAPLSPAKQLWLHTASRAGC
jgi:hypothetical protein